VQVVWGHAFFTYVNHRFKQATGNIDPENALVIAPPEASVPDPTFSAMLETLLKKSAVPLDAPRRAVRGSFICYQVGRWITTPGPTRAPFSSSLDEAKRSCTRQNAQTLESAIGAHR
jgi:hypothetical protein